MSILCRLQRLPVRNVNKCIHTSTYLRAAEPSAAKPHIVKEAKSSNLLNSTKLGRHRSTKLRRTKIMATLPESFLATNYIKHAALKPLPNKYASFVPEYVWKELEFTVRSGLTPKGALAAFDHTDHIGLTVPNAGSCYLQDHMVHQLAAKVKANVLTLDPQDFIFLAQHSFSRDVAELMPLLPLNARERKSLLAMSQEYQDNNSMPDTGDSSMSYQGHDTIDLIRQQQQQEEEGEDKEEDGIMEEYDQDEFDEDNDEMNEQEDDKVKLHFIPFGELHTPGGKVIQVQHSSSNSNSRSNNKREKEAERAIKQLSRKYTQMFKRHLSEGSSSENKIVYLRDYGGIHDQFSKILLNSLVDAVADLKQKGHGVMMVASHCQRTRKLDPDYPDILNMRRIPVLPSLQDENQLSEWTTLMKQDESRRIREINAKQLLAMYNHKSPQNLKTENQDDLLNKLLLALDDDNNKAIWTSSEVDRRVTTAIGHALEHNKASLDLQDFKAANRIVEQCTNMTEKSSTKLSTLSMKESLKLGRDGSIDLVHLARQCNDFERKLLTRVVDGTQVQGSFQDVRAPVQTINTLQSLISLPLLRPELFGKGILKKNFIPGVLLFGPPGTGKTMLAKAVAKDSGSRMLDIQASDVYEMYVGQGEKNVKAIFSLARKLSPCVIFIDEVDSLLNQRGSDQAARSHREIINQFMVEWDGLSSLNQGVIVMAATNRPFDLDDAVLRRMPRRILVDLPNEQDRAEILKILLKEEDHQVPIADLAKITRNYSGSDLKNLCVTAALKAVQEQAKTDKPQALTMEHFKEALKMVPASSSDEMESLVELKKWDAKYGDGKKNKKTSIGFS